MDDSNHHIFPTTLKHDDHNHDCGCVKCYFNNVTFAPKIEFVWIIEYFLIFITDYSYVNNSKKSNLYIISCPRSPPLYK